jgi:hypothetical protein
MEKPPVRQVERAEGVVIIDDTIVEKPHTDENEIICWYYDHSKGRSVKGINFRTALYYVQNVALPVAFEIVSKMETYTDKKIDQEKRRSSVKKNECYRQMLGAIMRN